MKKKTGYLFALALAALSLGACSGTNADVNVQGKALATNLGDEDANVVLTTDVITDVLTEELENQEENQEENTEENTPEDNPTEEESTEENPGEEEQEGDPVIEEPTEEEIEDNPTEEEESTEEPVEEETAEQIKVKKLKSLVNKYKALTNPNVYAVTEETSDNEDYDYKLNVALNIDENQKSVTLFFNEEVKDEETEISTPTVEDLDDVVDTTDIEDEITPEVTEEANNRIRRRHGGHDKDNKNCVRYDGILVYGENTIDVSGKRVTTDNYTYTKVKGQFDDRTKLVFESYVTDETVTFTYQISKGWRVKEAFYFSTEKVDNANKVSMTTYSDEGFASYDFVALSTTNALALQVTYSDDEGYGVYQILVEGDEFVYRTISEFTYPTYNHHSHNGNGDHYYDYDYIW